MECFFPFDNKDVSTACHSPIDLYTHNFEDNFIREYGITYIFVLPSHSAYQTAYVSYHMMRLVLM